MRNQFTNKSTPLQMKVKATTLTQFCMLIVRMPEKVSHVGSASDFTASFAKSTSTQEFKTV